MSKKEIINNLAKERYIETTIGNLTTSPYKQDLAQDLYIELLMKPDDLIDGLFERDELKFYVKKMIRLNINSNTSPFYTKYERYRKISDEIPYNL